jgi:soluble lytic murein transglycosylase-like protein
VTKTKSASTIASLFLFILSLCYFHPPETTAFCFEEAAKQYGLNSNLLRSIAGVESRCQPAALHQNSNGSTDFGLMQVNSFWIDKLGLDPGRLLQDPCYNVMTGAKILRQCVDRYGYTWEAVGCYNAASRDKRVSYSWKILRELKNSTPKSQTAEAGTKPQAKKTALADTTNRPRSLYFRVRAEVMPGELESP